MKKKIKSALVSVSDKTELIPVLKVLKKYKKSKEIDDGSWEEVN